MFRSPFQISVRRGLAKFRVTPRLAANGDALARSKEKHQLRRVRHASNNEITRVVQTAKGTLDRAAARAEHAADMLMGVAHDTSYSPAVAHAESWVHPAKKWKLEQQNGGMPLLDPNTQRVDDAARRRVARELLRQKESLRVERGNAMDGAPALMMQERKRTRELLGFRRR